MKNKNSGSRFMMGFTAVITLGVILALSDCSSDEVKEGEPKKVSSELITIGRAEVPCVLIFVNDKLAGTSCKFGEGLAPEKPSI